MYLRNSWDLDLESTVLFFSLTPSKPPYRYPEGISPSISPSSMF